MIEHKIIKSKNYAYIEIKQSPDLEAFLSAARIFVADPAFSAPLNRICDFSQADLSRITFDDFVAFVKFSKQEVPITEDTKIALVAPSPEKSAIFKTFADQIGHGRFQLFFDPMEAVEWIGQGRSREDASNDSPQTPE